MESRTKQGCGLVMNRRKSPRAARGLEAVWGLLPSPGGPRRGPGTVVQSASRTMIHAWARIPAGRAMAVRLVDPEHRRHATPVSSESAWRRGLSRGLGPGPPAKAGAAATGSPWCEEAA